MAFTSPNYTQMPNELFGDQKTPGAMADMNEAELKVTLALCRLTLGFHRDEVRASLSTLEKMTGLSRPAIIAAAEEAVKRGFIERIPTPPNTSSEWRVVVNQVNHSDQTSKPSLPPTSETSLPDTPQTSKASLHMKETSSKETLEIKPPPENNGGGKEGGGPPKDATRDEGYLPTAEEQMGMLIPGAARIDEAHTEAITAIERSSWRIGGDAKDALVEFMVATHIGIPRPASVRKDWTDALTYHAHEYGVSQLKTLYPAAVQYMRDLKLAYTRPASLTTALSKVAAEAKTAQPKQTFAMEWIEHERF